MKVDTSHVLMSDVLRGQVPDLDEQIEANTQDLARKHVLVVAEKTVGAHVSGIVGILRGALLGPEPEIEFRCQINEALDIIEASSLVFNKFELHHDERVLSVPGPFTVKAAKIDEISAQDQLCTLGLHLSRHTQRQGRL